MRVTRLNRMTVFVYLIIIGAGIVFAILRSVYFMS